MNSIHEAAVAGNHEKLKLLIENGANVNLKDSKGLRPLHYATWQARTESVYILLRSGAHVDEQSIDGDTPLHLASQYGHHDIVELLLFHHANPTILNRRSLTSLDLACEYGYFHVVNLLLQHRLCQQMLLNHSNNKEQHTPLHLAAKNGHTNIVRLLLLNGMDINRMTTNDGTALHVACRNGRYETAKLLLECGINIHLRNSYEQTVSEVVIKQKVGNDIKRLIKEFSDAIIVQAIRSYTDNHVGALNFSEGDCITVLDRNPTGQWRGFILQDDLTSRTGYFPSTYVQMSTSIINGKETQSYIDSHSPVDVDSMSRSSQTDSGLTTMSSWSSRSKRCSPLNNIYRHSAASSVDSGRSSTVLYDSPKTLALSSFMGVGDARSISSSESKSSDPDKTSYRGSNSSLDESNASNISKLLQNGASDDEIVFAWLHEFSYENYAENFITNGYDIQTIVRMTPEDLTAIGITHPSHRKKIKNEINRLHLPDGLPNFKPGTLHDWLCCIRLDQYLPLLNRQNYKTIPDILNIAWEDLEDIGITRLGHQKRFMLGIKRLSDIDKGLLPQNSCKTNPSLPLSRQQAKSTNERHNSLEHPEFNQKIFIRPCTTNGNSTNYATLRKPLFSSNTLANKHRIGPTSVYMPIISFRLPPPLSSTQTNSSMNNYSYVSSSSRARSLENINVQERKLEANYNPYALTGSQYAPYSKQIDDLQSFNESNLSSSTESTNGIPFANENIGTVRQRSPISQYRTLSNKQSLNTMKRSLPAEFFQQSNIHAITTTPIYDNNERSIQKRASSPNRHVRNTSLPRRERDLPSYNGNRRFKSIDTMKKNKENKKIKHDTTNVLSDIDSMLSDLNRELDQMLDYETTALVRS